MKRPLPGLPGGDAIPWDGKSNPYAIGVQHNPVMEAYEVIIHIGGFSTEAEAIAAADLIAPDVQRMLGGTQAPAKPAVQQ